MATKKFADHTLYHLSPKGFWKKFRDAVVVNPEISSGLPIASLNRYPQPGSRPEKYSTPATKASDPAQNPYWRRDVRRAYPQLSVVTQAQLAGFLLQSPEFQALSPPDAEPKSASAESAALPAVQTPPPSGDLVAAISHVTAKAPLFSETKLPPILPTPFARWKPQETENAPHDPDAYFPMSLVK